MKQLYLRCLFICMIAWLVLSQFSYAQESPQTQAPIENPDGMTTQTVEISNAKNPDWKSYRAMLKGVDAFEKFHARAPLAMHKFILKPRRPEVSLQGVSLRLSSDALTLAIPIGEDGSFSLPRDPQALEQNAELMINRKKDMFRWWPLVRSPGVLLNQRRLGDLRLECEMFWAIHYDDLPFVARNLVRALGGPCNTKKVTLSFPAEFMGLKEAILVQGERRQNLVVDKLKSSYTLSLLNADFSDDALIELIYEGVGENSQEPRPRNFNGLNVTAGF
jgi:hypothetical protein